jgi:hypothetical protein
MSFVLNSGVTTNSVTLNETTAPATPDTNTSVIYADSTSGDLMVKFDTGTTALVGAPDRSVFVTYSGGNINWNGTTPFNILSITLPAAGTWLVTARVNLTGNAIQTYIVVLSTTTASITPVNNAKSLGFGGLATYRSTTTFTTVFTVESATTIYMNAALIAAGTGTALDVTLGETADMSATRII